ncbi:hypothetical protein BDZ89DRAFT_248604 [Hymenopellis radicata]|nr:hypothetical protein BDZ89DRAFT_248604 [Hymenopellis radicata]
MSTINVLMQSRSVRFFLQFIFFSHSFVDGAPLSITATSIVLAGPSPLLHLALTSQEFPKSNCRRHMRPRNTSRAGWFKFRSVLCCATCSHTTTHQDSLFGAAALRTAVTQSALPCARRHDLDVEFAVLTSSFNAPSA